MTPAVQPIHALTSARGIAAWMVVLFHYREALPGWVPAPILDLVAQGYLAVDLFFLLSGYVIALNYAGEFSRLSLASIRRFLILRLGRIYPLHLFMLLLFLLNPIAILLFSAAATPGLRYEPVYFVLSLFLIQNWGFTDNLAWNVPSWSISTEWAAYLLFPLLALGLHRAARNAAVTLCLAGTLLAVLAVSASLSGLDNLGSNIPGFGLLRCLLGFATGMLLWRLRVLWSASAFGGGNLATLCAAACTTLYAASPWAIHDFIIMPLGFTLLIWALTDDAALLSRMLQVSWLRAIGTVSYSTYLVHYFVKDWVNFLLVRPGIPESLPILCYLAVTAVASALLYAWIEVPGRKIGRDLVSGSPRQAGWLARGIAP